MWQGIPYTNVHELNLDWIIERIKELEGIKAQSIAPTDTLINIADMVEGDLTNDNIVDAIRDALLVSSYIFIPKGKYTFNITLNQDCHIVMDDEAVIQSDNGSPCIDMHDSRFSLYGGYVESGLNDDSRTLYGNSIFASIVKCSDCHDIHIEGVKSTHSKHASVFQFRDCENVLVQNCSFSNFLLSAVWCFNYNRNIRINNCSFMYSKRPTGHEYCYFVCTGVTDFNTRITPLDGYIVENCYGYDSEDCGIDTHGAKNVIFRNNVVLETICALTAYNDNRRALRTLGWNMENILIENNYCVSNKDNEAGRTLPHPFVFVGSSNYYTEDEAGYEDNPGSYYSYCNCTIRNNYFKSVNSYGPDLGTVFLNQVSRNVLIEDNVIDSCNCNRGPRPNRCINFTIRNNTFLNQTGQTACLYSLGTVTNNVGSRYYTAGSYPSCVDGDGIVGDAITGGSKSTMLRLGQWYYDSSSIKVSKSYGIRFRPDITPPAAETIDVVDGVCISTKHGYIPGTYLKMTDGNGTIYRYIRDVIDMKRFIAYDGSGNPPPDGTYSVEMGQATVITLT